MPFIGLYFQQTRRAAGNRGSGTYNIYTHDRQRRSVYVLRRSTGNELDSKRRWAVSMGVGYPGPGTARGSVHTSPREQSIGCTLVGFVPFIIAVVVGKNHSISQST